MILKFERVRRPWNFGNFYRQEGCSIMWFIERQPSSRAASNPAFEVPPNANT